MHWNGQKNSRLARIEWVREGYAMLELGCCCCWWMLVQWNCMHKTTFISLGRGTKKFQLRKKASADDVHTGHWTKLKKAKGLQKFIIYEILCLIWSHMQFSLHASIITRFFFPFGIPSKLFDSQEIDKNKGQHGKKIQFYFVLWILPKFCGHFLCFSL